MITCPVCQHPNDDFAIKCSSCSSYLQERVPTLDLFSMMWRIVESPKDSLKKIILAEHKNFVLFISIFLGIAVVFALMWVHKSGDNYDNLLPLLLTGSLAGIAVGIPLLIILSSVFHLVAKVFRGKGGWKETYAVTGWSLIPIVFSVVFLLPLELATMGLYFFSSGLSGYDLKPTVFLILTGLDGICAVWTIILISLGMTMLHRFHFVFSLGLVLVVIAAVSYFSSYIFSSFNI